MPPTHSSGIAVNASVSKEQFPVAPAEVSDSRFDIIIRKLGKLDEIEAKLNQLPELINRLNEHEARLSVLEEKQQTQEQRIDDAAAATRTLDAGVKESLNALEQENETLKRQIKEQAVHNRKLSSQVLNIASYTKLPEITISGLTYALYRFGTAVCCTASALDLDIAPSDVINVRRTGKRKTARATTAGSSTDTSSQDVDLSDLTIKLRSLELVQKFIDAKRKIRQLHTSNLDTASLTAAAAPSPQMSALININEKLPAPVFHLLMEAKHKAKPLGYQHVWYNDGCIKAKYSDSSRVIHIRSEEDLTLIVPVSSTGTQSNFRAS